MIKNCFKVDCFNHVLNIGLKLTVFNLPTLVGNYSHWVYCPLCKLVWLSLFSGIQERCREKHHSESTQLKIRSCFYLHSYKFAINIIITHNPWQRFDLWISSIILSIVTFVGRATVNWALFLISFSVATILITIIWIVFITFQKRYWRLWPLCALSMLTTMTLLGTVLINFWLWFSKISLDRYYIPQIFFPNILSLLLSALNK